MRRRAFGGVAVEDSGHKYLVTPYLVTRAYNGVRAVLHRGESCERVRRLVWGSLRRSMGTAGVWEDEAVSIYIR